MSSPILDEYLEKTARTWGEFGSNLLRAPLATTGHALSAAGSLPNAVVGTPLAAVSNSVAGINNVANRVSNATIGRNTVPKAMQAATSEVNNNINASVGGAWKDVGQGAARALTNNYGDGLNKPYQSAGAAALNKQHAMNPDPVSRGVGQWASTIGNTVAGLATGGAIGNIPRVAGALGGLRGAASNAMSTAGKMIPAPIKGLGSTVATGAVGATVLEGISAGKQRSADNTLRQEAGALQPTIDSYYSSLAPEARTAFDAQKQQARHYFAAEHPELTGPSFDAAFGKHWNNLVSGDLKGAAPQGAPVDAAGQPAPTAEPAAQPAPQTTPESVIGQDGTVEGGLSQPEQKLSPLTSDAVAQAKDLLSKNPDAVKQVAAGTEKQVQDAVADPKIKDEVGKALSGKGFGPNILNNAVTALMKVVEDPKQIGPMLQAMSPAEVVGLGLGLTFTAMGVMQLLSGKGGLGSIITTIAGLGAAGAAFGNANSATPAFPHGPSGNDLIGNIMSAFGAADQTKANTQGAIAAGAVQPQTNSPQSGQGVAGGAQSDTKAPGAGQASQLSPEVAAALAGLDKNDPQYEDKVLSLVRNEPIFKSNEADMEDALPAYGLSLGDNWKGPFITSMVNSKLTKYTGEKDPARLAKMVEAFRRMKQQPPATAPQ